MWEFIQFFWYPELVMGSERWYMANNDRLFRSFDSNSYLVGVSAAKLLVYKR